MLVALPLTVAVVLFALTDPGGGPASAPGHDIAVAEDFAMKDVSPVPTLAPGTTDAAVPPTAVDAGMLPGQESAVAFPGQGAAGDGAEGDGAEGHGAEWGHVDGDGPDASAAPTAPSGHRPVALRIADPAALSLVAAGDRVDVVGMDGSVLAEGLEVLRNRSSGAGSVLVLAAPDGASAALAAAALSREVTVILSAEPSLDEPAP